MKLTPKLGLKKPEDTDLYDIENENYNMDILDNVAVSSDASANVTVIPVISATAPALTPAAISENEQTGDDPEVQGV